MLAIVKVPNGNEKLLYPAYLIDFFILSLMKIIINFLIHVQISNEKF